MLAAYCLGLEEAGAYGIDRYASVCPFHCSTAREVEHCTLAALVGNALGLARTAYAAEPEYGTDIDDPAVTTLEHSAPKGPGQAERCHEFEIHVQHEGLIAYLLQGSGRTAAAVVNKDVYLAKVRKHSLYCSVELLS